MIFLKAIWVRYRLLRGEAIPVNETMSLALRYRWLFDNRWFYSPSVRAMLAVHDGIKEVRKRFREMEMLQK